MNVPKEHMIVLEMVEFAKILQILTLADVLSIIWMFRLIAQIVLVDNVNDVRLCFYYFKYKITSVINECITGQNDCSSEATCTDTEDSYICACPSNYIDVSPDTVNRPGRRCLKSIFYMKKYVNF